VAHSLTKRINGHKWRALQPAYIPPNAQHPERGIQVQMRVFGQTREEAIAAMERYEAKCRYFRNDLYQVQVRTLDGDLEGFVHINIRRIDGAPCTRDWRHFQQIKNEIVGEECEAIELYPAESRLTDTSNKYHLWACTSPTFRFPVGFDTRDVSDDDGSKQGGSRQRRL